MVDPALLTRLPLLVDGAPADALARRQPRWAAAPAALNQEQPEAVQALHAAYVGAGARVLRTNTAGAIRPLLEPLGLGERTEALNNSGSALARQALEPPGLVLGTLAPPPAAVSLSDDAWQRAYGEQVIYLADTGVDAFVLEHVAHLADALRLTRIVTRATDAPVLALLRFDAHGGTADGHGPAACARQLADVGAGALGIGCGPAPDAWPLVLDGLATAGLPLAVLAGIATVPDAGLPYPGAPAMTPHAFAAALRPLAERGVMLLGGCCGVSPAHIAALAQALDR